jgi:UDP-N-acetylglucosamine 3-dehydrogenase
MKGIDEMTRVGLFGAGFMGATHGHAYAAIPGVELVVVDQDLKRAESLAAEVGGKASSDPNVIYGDPSIDAVDVTLPTPFHPEFAIRALQSGKHVIIEKPLALTLDEVDSIISAAKKSGKFMMVAHVIRFWPEYIAVQQVLKSGRLGRPLLATSYRMSNMPQWANWFRDPAAFGGAVLDLQIHDLDFMNLMFGVPQSVSAIGLKDDTGGWNHVVTQIKYPSGLASVEAGSMMPLDYPFTAGLKVMCEKGVIEFHFRAGGASFEQGQPVSYLVVHEPGHPSQPLAFEPGDGYLNELTYFIQCVKSGTPPARVTPADARLAVQTALASRASLERGEAVPEAVG